jgi:hypothetical protein
MLHSNSGIASYHLGVLLVFSVSGCDAPSATATRPDGINQLNSGESASTLIGLDGRGFDLWQGDDDAAATVVVFTRSDCPISNRYAPTIKEMYEEYQPRGVRFFLVYVDPKQEPDEIRRHLKEFQYPCPAVRDPTHALVAVTGATVTPEAVVFDAEREITYRGRIDDLYADFGQSRDEATTHELADAIEAVLSGQPVREAVTEAVGCPIGDLE